MEELQHLDRSGRRADVDGLDLVEAEHRAQPREYLGVGRCDLLGELRRHLLPPLLHAHLAHSRRECGLGPLALLPRLAGDHRLEPRLQLLPDAWHGEEPAGSHFR